MESSSLNRCLKGPVEPASICAPKGELSEVAVLRMLRVCPTVRGTLFLLSGDGSWREGKAGGGEAVVRTTLAVIEVQDLAG